MGYNTSSVAESTNRIIKLDSKTKKISLADFRAQFDSAHKRAKLNNDFIEQKKLIPVNFPFIGIVEHVSKTCIIEIYKSIQKCIRSYNSIEENPWKFQVYHVKNMEQIFEVSINDNTISCTFNQSLFNGYRCVHILHILLTVNPEIQFIGLINKHWLNNQNTELKKIIHEKALEEYSL